jgi:hypothetical protein
MPGPLGLRNSFIKVFFTNQAKSLCKISVTKSSYLATIITVHPHGLHALHALHTLHALHALHALHSLHTGHVAHGALQSKENLC